MALSRTQARAKKSMSTWISKAIGLCALSVVTGCTGDLDVGRGLAGGIFTQAAPDKITVTDDVFTVAGPPGYCVDEGSVQDDGSRAFVLLGSCASLTRNADSARPRLPAVLTVSISGANLPTDGLDSETIQALLETDTGLQALSRDGTIDGIEVQEVLVENDMVFVQVNDRSEAISDQISDNYWRSFFGIGNRLVSTSVVGFADQPLTRDAGFSIVSLFSQRLISENASGEGGAS